MTGRRYAYADPPYPGQARKLYGAEAAAGRVAIEVNHLLLIGHLLDEYPDGWALSTSTPALRQVLNLCHDQGIPDADIRVGSWCKPFAVYKPGVPVAYTWEPVIFHGGRAPRDRAEPTIRDHLVLPDDSPAVSANVTLQRGVVGAKPARFTRWVCAVLGVLPGDQVDDLFPGSGAVRHALDDILGTRPPEPGTLFADHA